MKVRANPLAECPHYDIIFVADPRFEGGASTALVQEMEAAHRSGLRPGLLMVKGSLLGRANFWMHPGIRSLIEAAAVDIVDPAARVSADLTIIHHPTIFAVPPRQSPRLRTEKVVLVLPHPRLDRIGKIQYDLPTVTSICADTFGRDVILAPVSEIVRASLPADLPVHTELLTEDWHNIINPDEWPLRPARPPRYPVVIGRHARPDAAKWPDERRDAMAAYSPDGDFCRVRILGGGPFLNELYGDLPQNWEQLPFGWAGVQSFLASLDFYVYFHSDAWSEAFGRTVLEAMATGVPAILPPYMRSSFGEAALYCTPSEVPALIERLVSNLLHYERQSQRGLSFARRHMPGSFVERLQRLFAIQPRCLGGCATAVPPDPAASQKKKKSVLFVSTNGIGIGHITQQLAIASRLPHDIQSVFATMSYGMKLLQDAGYLAHFISYHRHYEADPHRWNRALREELLDLIAFTRPSVIAFDGSYPFEGLLQAIAAFPEIVSIWVRRPMWPANLAAGLTGSDGFDHVIEPGELADAFDDGPTKPLQRWAYCVPPVLYSDPVDRLSLEEARRVLGTPQGATIVALQLGSGQNFDLAPLRRDLIERLLRRPSTIVVELRSPIRADFAPEETFGDRHRIVELFPSYRVSQAFDFAVAAAGYNNFHENIFGAIPTIFVPNEAPEMDVQLNRARFADVYGYGCLLRRDHDRFGVADVLERLNDPSERAEMQRRCRALNYTNGAVDAARLIADSVHYLRTDVPFVQKNESGS